MAREIPKAQKVNTTRYQNFKGVDFTNDPTNVWYRRSPDAVNMLPDASGRPFKRHGWDILLDNETISTYIGVTSCTILKCSYFELAGTDHIVIFTDAGVAFYNDHSGFTAKETDPDCYSGYDRCFFFEGEGTSAFYIYGNYRVWKYDSTFTLTEVTGNLTIPTVVAGAEADGTGTVLNGYNLLGTKAWYEYHDINLFTWWCSDDITIEVDSAGLKTYLGGTPDSQHPIYRWTWNGSTWTDTNSTGKSFPSSCITIHGTQSYDAETGVGDEVIVLFMLGVMLPNNVSNMSEISAWATATQQFDTPLDVISFDQTLATKQCKFWQDDTNNYSKGRAWLEFYDAWTEKVEGEDFIRVEFPSVNVVITDFNNPSDSELIDNGTADLIYEVAE